MRQDVVQRSAALGNGVGPTTDGLVDAEALLDALPDQDGGERLREVPIGYGCRRGQPSMFDVLLAQAGAPHVLPFWTMTAETAGMPVCSLATLDALEQRKRQTLCVRPGSAGQHGQRREGGGAE